MNANDATLTGLASAQTGSKVHDHAPNAPASGAFALIIAAAAGSALGRSGAPYALTVLHQAFDAAGGWKLSSTGPDYGGSASQPRR